jgi:catechol 2,3-dioxygenase-like lactoylglutathione lyase family enzyme
MDLSLKHCFINVLDPELSLAFYRDVLGLELRNDVARGGFRWVTVSPASQPDIEIVLTNSQSGSPSDGEALQALVAKGAMNGVVFTTPDVDATFEKVQAAGAEVLQEPIDQPWGVRVCAFRDPSGNMIRINQQPKN